MKLIYPILPDGRFKALTLSFDDGRVQDRRLVTLLNRCGIKATFNLNSGEQGENRLPLCEYAALYAGHEIAAHGVRHPGMTAAPLPLAAQQVLEDRRALEQGPGGARDHGARVREEPPHEAPALRVGHGGRAGQIRPHAH